MATAKNNKKGKKINTTIKKVINSEVKEIKKETKKNYNLGWLWVLIGIVLPPVGIILYFIFSHFRNKSRFAFSSVTAITSSLLIPFSSAIIAATYGRFSELFLLPRFGSGLKYGLSVSNTSCSSGAYSTTSFSFFAFLNVTTPPIPR